MKNYSSSLLALFLATILHPSGVVAQDRSQLIIDMHLHALTADNNGPPLETKQESVVPNKKEWPNPTPLGNCLAHYKLP